MKVNIHVYDKIWMQCKQMWETTLALCSFVAQSYPTWVTPTYTMYTDIQQIIPPPLFVLCHIPAGFIVHYVDGTFKSILSTLPLYTW